MNGIDISLWQKGLELSKIQCDFVIIKATEGNDIVDPQFKNFAAQAQALGKPMGFYHFARPDLNKSEDEARFFLRAVKDYIRKGVLMLDWECGDLSKTYWAKNWLDEVYLQTGVRPMVYTSQSCVNAYNWQAVVDGNYGLWCAKWADNLPDYNYDMSRAGSKPTVKWWPFVAMWQWTSKGRLDGYEGNLDCDVFYGDVEAWNKYAGKVELNTYKVKEGDTLTGIAEQFGKSVDEIVERNDLIKPGQILIL